MRSELKFAGVLVLLAAVVVGIVALLQHRGSSGPSGADVAAAAGALSPCTDTGFSISSALDHSKVTVWACDMGTTGTRCITDDSGVVRDATSEVRLLEAGVLNGKPDCG